MQPKLDYMSETDPRERDTYQSQQLKNSKAVGVLWGVFTVCFAIINVVIFVQPHWLGDTQQSKGTGHFGLWQACRLVQDGQDVFCEGRLDDFNTITSSAFRAATVFVGLSVITIMLCISCMLLFFFFNSSTIFHVCGWMQLFCSICMLVGVLTFPAGWDSEVVKEVCGSEAKDYSPGQCEVRWAYILAIIGVCDCTVLAILAFVLGTRYVRLLPDQYVSNSSPKQGDTSINYISERHSLTSQKSNNNLQPPMLVPPICDPERFSEFSHRTGHSKSSWSRDDFESSINNYRL
ncbi:lipoma HMGIC fusion partner-like 3 protein isoform X2 [Limulus polyphemus]|uniref:Lipoma HMGIC fusion partner-like 3 protein isoform X2 n=1 Tax=Limulus polyphemus TaxID=6850 RepID=A0ABM1BT36_LIMPO|nr:lipoma HMGIC fusion partner-like 3 protein isoform X2 [Limulus polyphemus]